MDKNSVDNLINIVIDNENNSNNYEGLSVLLSSLSEDEVKYFIEECGERLFDNDKLNTIMWETHPLIFFEYVIKFIDEKIERIEDNLSALDYKLKAGEIEKNEYDELTNGFSMQKQQLSLLRNNFVSNIIHLIKEK